MAATELKLYGPYTTAERDGLTSGGGTLPLFTPIYNSDTQRLEGWNGTVWVPLSPTMGTATLDFGAFPGKSDASVAVTGQTGIVAGSKVMAWLQPAATADHTADEHMLETMKVFAGNIVAGTGFTIYGINDNQLSEPLLPIQGQNNDGLGGAAAAQDWQQPTAGGRGTRLYGAWNVAWLWQ